MRNRWASSAAISGESEQTVIRERIKAGMSQAKARGVRIGRPTISREMDATIRAALAEGKGIRETSRLTGASAATVVRVDKEMKSRGTGCVDPAQMTTQPVVYDTFAKLPASYKSTYRVYKTPTVVRYSNRPVSASPVWDFITKKLENGPESPLTLIHNAWTNLSSAYTYIGMANDRLNKMTDKAKAMIFSEKSYFKLKESKDQLISASLKLNSGAALYSAVYKSECNIRIKKLQGSIDRCTDKQNMLDGRLKPSKQVSTTPQPKLRGKNVQLDLFNEFTCEDYLYSLSREELASKIEEFSYNVGGNAWFAAVRNYCEIMSACKSDPCKVFRYVLLNPLEFYPRPKE